MRVVVELTEREARALSREPARPSKFTPRVALRVVDREREGALAKIRDATLKVQR